MHATGVQTVVLPTARANVRAPLAIAVLATLHSPCLPGHPHVRHPAVSPAGPLATGPCSDRAQPGPVDLRRMRNLGVVDTLRPLEKIQDLVANSPLLILPCSRSQQPSPRTSTSSKSCSIPTPIRHSHPPAQSKSIPMTKFSPCRLAQFSHAFPIRTMGYHHIVNDEIAGQPFAATYCTLCHTGLIWSRVLDGQILRFRLAGINNGNALMRDEQTSSIWQQSTGQAIFGPLKGKQLTLVHSDELTFALWTKENPNGLVLKPDEPYASEYEDKDWEQQVLKTRTVVDTSKSGIPAHELMLGITLDGSSKAYPIKDHPRRQGHRRRLGSRANPHPRRPRQSIHPHLPQRTSKPENFPSSSPHPIPQIRTPSPQTRKPKASGTSTAAPSRANSPANA